MLEYIYSNNIPMDALVLTEQVTDYYLENEDDSKNWNYYTCKDIDYLPDLKLLPIHNDFGSCYDKKAFVIWMHY
jgi:hypothetical protein